MLHSADWQLVTDVLGKTYRFLEKPTGPIFKGQAAQEQWSVCLILEDDIENLYRNVVLRFLTSQ